MTDPALAPDASAAVPAAVQEALALLGQLDQRDTDGHVAVFDEVHRLLRDTLAAVDEV